MTRRGIGGVVRAEWIKLVTVRSTLVAYAATLAASALAAAMIFTLPGADSDGDAGDALLVLVVLVELLAGTIGVLAATSEYSGGTIRATLAAVPSRTPVLVAKAIVHGGTVLVACGLATVMGFAAASILAPDDLAPVSDGEVARGLAGSAFAFSFAAVLGVALGLLTRSTATSLGILFALMFAPVLITFQPEVTAYVPGRAAQAVVLADNPAEARLLDTGPAIAAVLAWAAAALGAAAVALRRRDA